MGWGSLGSIVGVRGPVLVVFLFILRECIWNAPTVSLVVPAFDDTGSLGSPPRHAVYPPGSTLSESLLFPCGE